MKIQSTFAVLLSSVSLLLGANALAGEASAPALTDPMIAQIAVTANAVDAEAGKVGRKSKNAEVKAFAEMMVNGHTSVKNQAIALAKKLHVTPVKSGISESLQKGGNENVAALKKLKGTAFDKAYIHHEVAYHQAVLDAINKTLIPNAKNEELKALLEKASAIIAGHLERAKAIDDTIKM